MMTQLKNQFMQATLGTILWVVLLISLTDFQSTVSFSYFWNIIGIGLIIGVIFGVFYPYLWNYLSLSVPVNILLSTFVNVSGQFMMLYLYSVDMFTLVMPYLVGIIVLTLIIHIIAFYFYKKHQNKKMADELNKLQN